MPYNLGAEHSKHTQQVSGLKQEELKQVCKLKASIFNLDPVPKYKKNRKVWGWSCSKAS